MRTIPFSKPASLFLAGAALLAGSWAMARPAGYVNDQAGVLDASTKQQINSLLMDLEKKTSAEVAVVTVKSLGDETIEGAAQTIFSQLKIGKKDKDNGVLFLIAPVERKMRIEVGYGLEGALPDGRAGRLMDELILPFFKQGQMKEGILMGTAGIAQVIAQDAGVQLSPGAVPRYRGTSSEQREPTLGQKIFGVVLIIALIYLFIRHPWLFFFLLMSMGRRGGGGWSGGGFGGGFGGFGGGMSGGGGASRGW